jgi:hypothetical protein
MAFGHEATEKVYRAIVYIEKEGVSSLKPYSRTITSFVRGSELSPYFYLYRSHPDVCGSLKKAEIWDVTSCCEKLAADGFLAKHQNGDKVLYSTTSKDYLASITEPAKENSNDSFYSKITISQKKILDVFIDHFSHAWSGIVCLDFKNYYGFKAVHFLGTPNLNWFWISVPSDSDTRLHIKTRTSPRENTVAFECDFDFDKALDVLKKIDEILSRKFGEFGLSQKSVEPSKTTSQNKQDQPERSNSQDSARAIEETNHFNLRKYCRSDCDFFINDGKVDPTEALLLAGESSPFLFTKSTIYGPFFEMKKILNNAKYFDFSIRKWKMVAWSTAPHNQQAIQEVLFIGRKTKSVWLLVDVPNREVKVFTKWGFFLETSEGRISSGNLVSLLH